MKPAVSLLNASFCTSMCAHSADVAATRFSAAKLYQDRMQMQQRPWLTTKNRKPYQYRCLHFSNKSNRNIYEHYNGMRLMSTSRYGDNIDSRSDSIALTNLVRNNKLAVSRLGLDPARNKNAIPIVHHEHYSFDNWPEKHTFPVRCVV